MPPWRRFTQSADTLFHRASKPFPLPTYYLQRGSEKNLFFSLRFQLQKYAIRKNQVRYAFILPRDVKTE